MAKKVNLEEGDLPKGLDLPGDDLPEAKPAQRAPSRQAAAGDRVLSSTDMDRLSKMPKADIKAEMGIDIDYMVRMVNEGKDAQGKTFYNLKALAYGDFTSPINVSLKAGHLPRMEMLATVRIYTFPDGDWAPDVHPVRLKDKIDKEGNVVRDDSGKVIKIYDRNPITMDDVNNQTISFGGKPLSREQIDHLRLTGHLGSAIVGTNLTGQTRMTVISVDPYNNHELCTISESAIRARIKGKETFQYRDANKELRTVKLTDKMKGELAVGALVWGKDDRGSQVPLQYNAFTSRIERSVDYEYKQRQERNAALEQKRSQGVTQEQGQTNAQVRGVGTSL